MNPFKHILVLFLALFLVACASTDDEPIADTGEQQMYEEAQRHLANANYDLAVRSLQLLEAFAENAAQQLLVVT